MNKKIILVIGLLLSFILLISSLVLFMSAQRNINRTNRSIDVTNIDTYTLDELKTYILDKPDRSNLLYYIIPISAFSGLFIGFLIYYFLNDKIEKTIKSKNKLVLNLLTKAERKVLQKIIDHQGRIRQYELTYIKGLNKVKVHRIIRKLEENDIIKKEKLGKVNNIILVKEIYNYFKD